MIFPTTLGAGAVTIVAIPVPASDAVKVPLIGPEKFTDKVSNREPPTVGLNFAVSVQVAVLARVVEHGIAPPETAEKLAVPTPSPLRVITPPELLVIVKDAEGLELPTLVLGKVFEIGEMVTVGAPAEDSYAPMSHGPDAGRAIPAASKHAIGISMQS